jgi:hypothetical protein
MVATAAAAGPTALTICHRGVGLYVPLVFTRWSCRRVTRKKAPYVWSKRAFGPFAASSRMITGSNRRIFPACCTFMRRTRCFGARRGSRSSNSTYFIAVAMTGLVIAVTMNVVGLSVGKWLSNVGAIAGWIGALVLMALGAVSWSRFGTATPMNAHALVPSTSLKDVIFWSPRCFRPC